MARRRSLAGTRPQHAARGLKLWNVIEDHAINAREAAETGDCMNSLNHLEKAFESSGESLAENFHGKFYDPKREEEVEELLYKADKMFKDRCLRGIRGGGSPPRGYGAARGGSMFPLYDEPGIDTEPERDEPEEDDITTTDHRRWFQSGKLYFTGDEEGLKRKMEADHFWPNVWFISDHGNAHLITL